MGFVPLTALAQVAPDEETTWVVPDRDADEETTVVRRHDTTATDLRKVEDVSTLPSSAGGKGIVIEPRVNPELKQSETSDEETSLMTSGRPGSSVGAVASGGVSFPTGRIQGYFYNSSSFDTSHDSAIEDVFDIRTKLGLALEVTTPSMAKGYVAGRFSHFTVGEDAGDDDWWLYNSRNVKSEFEVELREAYVYVPWDVVNLRVGSQIVRWGFAQFNKPADVLNPSDLREGLFSDLEVPLLPVFMVHVDRNFGPANLSVVWIPFFTPNRVNLFGQDWALLTAMADNPAFASLSGIDAMLREMNSFLNPLLEDRMQPILLATRPPEENIENGQYGSKLEFNLDTVDLFLSYFYGWDRLPSVFVEPLFAKAMAAMAGENPDRGKVMGAMLPLLVDEKGQLRKLSLDDLFRTSYRRQQTVGMGFATILFDRVGLRVDASLSPSRTVYLEPVPPENNGRDAVAVAPLFPAPAYKPTVSYSAGVDYSRSTWLNLGLEFYHFHVFDLARGERVFVIGSDLYMLTALAIVRMLEFDRLEFQLAGMSELDSRSVFLFPKISYKLTDDLKIACGAQIIDVLPGGREMSPGGLFDRNDSVYGEVKWNF